MFWWYLLFIANWKTKLHTKLLIFFNCASSLSLGLAKDLQKLWWFIEAKKTFLMWLLIKVILFYVSFCYVMVLSFMGTIPLHNLLYMLLLVVGISISNWFKLLIEFVVSPNKVDDSKKTLSWAVVDGGHIDISKLLLDHKAMLTALIPGYKLFYMPL